MRIAPPFLPSDHSSPATCPLSQLKHSSVVIIWMCRASFTSSSCPLPWSSTVVAEHVWENHNLIYWEETMVLDHSRGGEGGPAHPDDTRGGALKPRWRIGSPWLLRCDEETGREEQSSPTFDLQWCVLSIVHGYKWQRLFALFSLSPWWRLEHSKCQ